MLRPASRIMIVTCPNCAAKYKIDRTAIGDKGRMVACANCRHRWFVASDQSDHAPMPDQMAVAVEAAGPERPWRGEGTGIVRRGSKSGAVGWIVLVALVAVLAGLVLGRDQLAATWPRLAGVYQAAGLTVNVHPELEIRNVASSEVTEDGQRILMVSGEVVNMTDYAKSLPALRVALLDADRVEVASDMVVLEPKILEARATVRFEKRLEDVPAEARHTAVHFEDAS